MSKTIGEEYAVYSQDGGKYVANLSETTKFPMVYVRIVKPGLPTLIYRLKLFVRRLIGRPGW